MKAKEKMLNDLKKKVEETPVVGILTVRNLPSKQLQQMRAKLGADILMARKNLMLRTIKAAKKKDLEKLVEYIDDQPAFIFTDINPFKLYSRISKEKASAPAKGGEIAPNDITVSKGETPFSPGPVLGELKSVGIPVAVEKGKIAVTEDATIVKAGEQITPKVAEIITRLGIEPLEIGLDLLAVYEDGEVYPKDILAVDEDEYARDIQETYRNALGLSMSVGYLTPANIGILISKSFRDSKAIALEGCFLSDETTPDILSMVESQAKALSDELEKKEVK